MPGRSVQSLAVSFFILGLLPAFADSQIIPQVADGAGWATTIVLVNKTSSTQSAALSFNMDTVDSATTPWTPPFNESVSLSSISLPAGSALFLHTPGTAATLTQGWGQLDAATGVTGYAIFTSRATGTAQDGTAPAVSASSRILVPFDNTSGLISAFAMANPNNAAEIVQVNIRTSDGMLSGTLPILPAKGQTTFLIPQLFPGTAGKSGLAEFYVAGAGTISIIALRANGSAFTAAPVYVQSGSPIIGAPTNVQNSSSQTQVIPQVADGAGWATTIVLTNTTTGDLPFTLNFKQATPNGAGVTTTWNPPFQDTSALGSNIPAGSSIFLRTPGNATALSQGWAELAADPRVTGYAIFTSRQGGGPAQDSTAPAVSASSRILVPFDNSSNLIMALALVNPNPSPESVSVNFRTSDGTTTGIAPNLPSQGQVTFLMPQQFSDTGGKSGLAEFYVSSGTISIIALRANPSGAVTSAPVFFETGTPVITTGSGGDNGGGGSGGQTGGGGSILPTQQEIDSWISRGNYVSGSIDLGRSTIYFTVDNVGANGVTPTTTITKGDGVNAHFSRTSGADLGKALRGELPPGYPNLAPSPGTCAVYDITALNNPFPNLTTVGLDAGPQITVNGPNGTQAAVRQGSQSIGFSYRAANVPNTYLAPGHYTFSGPGGADIGSFSGALDTVPDFVVTNPDDFKVIDRASGVTVHWTGGDSSTVVTIAGGSIVVSQSGSASGFAFSCIQNTSAGSFTVPGSILTQLAPSATLSVGGFTLVTRGSFSVVAPGRGVRLPTPSGMDILTANNGWTWTFSPQYK